MRACLAAILCSGCSLVLDFSGDLVDASPQIDGGVFDAGADADPSQPDAGPTPRELYEPNESFAEAQLIEPGTFGPIAVYPVGDHDFYRFTLTADHDVLIQVLFSNADGDLDLKLYDASMALIPPTSEGTDDDEEIQHTTGMNGRIGPGDFYIEVYGYNNSYFNESYTLVLMVI
jgi:hypothetical protein